MHTSYYVQDEQKLIWRRNTDVVAKVEAVSNSLIKKISSVEVQTVLQTVRLVFS